MTSRWHSSLKRLRGDRSGASAIEFALVAPLVFALSFSIAEAGWIMTQSIMLDRAFSKAVRAVQVEGATLSYTDLKARICDEALVLSNCMNSIRLELTPINKSTDFPTASAPCVDRSVPIDPVTTYNSGQRSQVIFARACFVVDPLVPGIGLGLSMPKDATGGIHLNSSFAFVNEPV